MRDFIHDRYDISHIKDDFYLQKDFFLYQPNSERVKSTIKYAGITGGMIGYLPTAKTRKNLTQKII
jgi:hypothetical protein